jgi:hypothetical protein
MSFEVDYMKMISLFRRVVRLSFFAWIVLMLMFSMISSVRMLQVLFIGRMMMVYRRMGQMFVSRIVWRVSFHLYICRR